MTPPPPYMLLEDYADTAAFVAYSRRTPHPAKWCKDDFSGDDSNLEQFGPR